MIDERPDLDLRLSAGIFRQYYYLKEELVDFCHRNKTEQYNRRKLCLRRKAQGVFQGTGR